MKKILMIAISLCIAGCAGCQKEDEDFIPYPGGTCPKEQPQA